MDEDLIAVLPDAVPCGGQTMAAAAGGGGACTCWATSWTVEQVVMVFTAARGEPERRTAVAANWRFPSAGGASFIDVFAPSEGGAPGYRADQVPSTARAVVAFGYAYTGGGARHRGGGVLRRLFTRR